MSRRQTPRLTVVVPVFNEEDVLPLTHERLERAFAGLDARWEVLFVDDGSRDKTPELLRRICQKDPRYKAVILSRNFGHQVALSAGLDHAEGDVVVVLDADLQDPPELVVQMLAKWREGYEVVYGQRARRIGETWLKKATAHWFYRLMRRLAGVDIPSDVGDFRLMDRKAVEAFKRMPERFRFVRGMVAWCGFRQCAVVFERPPRAAGVTKYRYSKMIRFALDAVFSFSAAPLRLATLLAAPVLAAALLSLGHWLLFAVLLVGGLNLLALGIIGEYVGRLYAEAQGRPLYLVQEYLACARSSPQSSATTTTAAS